MPEAPGLFDILDEIPQLVVEEPTPSPDNRDTLDPSQNGYEEPIVQEPVSDPQVTDPKIQAYRDQQARADRAEQQLRELQEQLGIYGPYVKLLQEKPELTQVILEKIQPPQQQEEVLVRPALPQRPANYSRAEALEDPKSESALYEEAMTKYHYDKEVYESKLEERRSAQEAKQLQEQERIAQEQEALENQKKMMVYVATNLVKDFGFNKEQVIDFMNFVNEKPTLTDFVNFYKASRGLPVSKQVKPPTQPPVTPSFAGPSVTQGPVDTSDSFSKSLKGQDKSWIFNLK